MLFGHQDTTNQTPAIEKATEPVVTPAAQDDPLRIDPVADMQMPSDLEELQTPTPSSSALQQPGTSTAASDDGTQASTADAPVDGDLLSLKQQALTELTPLVGQLDQSPEEKFRTTMMMIQSSDNSALIKEAYAAAQQISDEKARAQALLDVVNEINYFTHKNDK